MTEMVGRLKKLWITVMLLILVMGIAGYIMHPAETVFSEVMYWVKALFLIMILVLVPASSIYQARSIKRHTQDADTVRLSFFEKGFKIRMAVFSLLAVLGTILLFMTGDKTYPKIIALLVILLAVNFPSQGLVERELKKSDIVE